MPAAAAPASATSSTPANAKPTFWESFFGKPKAKNATLTTGGRRRNKNRSVSRKNLKTRKNRKNRKSRSNRH